MMAVVNAGYGQNPKNPGFSNDFVWIQTQIGAAWRRADLFLD